MVPFCWTRRVKFPSSFILIHPWNKHTQASNHVSSCPVYLFHLKKHPSCNKWSWGALGMYRGEKFWLVWTSCERKAWSDRLKDQGLQSLFGYTEHLASAFTELVYLPERMTCSSEESDFLKWRMLTKLCIVIIIMPCTTLKYICLSTWFYFCSYLSGCKPYSTNFPALVHWQTIFINFLKNMTVLSLLISIGQHFTVRHTVIYVHYIFIVQ